MSTDQVCKAALHCTCNAYRRGIVLPRLPVLACRRRCRVNPDCARHMGCLHTTAVQSQALGARRQEMRFQ